MGNPQPVTWFWLLVGVLMTTRFLAQPISAETQNPVSCVDHVAVRGLSQPRKLTLLAAQGLVNRTGPNVYLDFGAENRWMQMDYTEKPDQNSMRMWSPEAALEYEKKYPTINEAWIDLLTKNSKFIFKPVQWESFLAKLGPSAKGWIVYDNFEDEVALMGTLAGQLDGLPVLRQDLSAMQKILPELPILFDTKSIGDLPGVTRKVAAHRWMIDNVLDRVNKTGLVSRVKSYGLAEHDTFVDVDQAVQQKWLVYDLTHYSDDTADKPDSRLSRPDESAELQRVLSHYSPLTPVFGWGASDENTFVRTITKAGLTVICSGVPNNSFFNGWKASKLPLKQRHTPIADADVKVEKKIYLAFMVNEGDSIKNALALQGHGAWLQPERGTVPMNWGVEPAIFERYSGLMEFFYQGATANDYFFTAAAGWGYLHPCRLTPEMARKHVVQVNKGLLLTDTDYVDIWWMPGAGPVWDEYARGLNVKGLTQWYHPAQKVDFKVADFPVIYSNHYYTLSDPKDFATMLAADYKDMMGPWFVIVYGAKRHMTPYKAKAVMNHLPTERFKAVLLDEFFAAARLAQQAIEGKVWRPGPDAPKGIAP